MSSTLEELIYYCNEAEPTGAFMLTGEWGCGKTYLLENDLKKKLEKTHIIVRVSLFGINSVEALNEAVKKQWIAKCTTFFSKVQNQEKAIKASRSIFGITAPLIPYIKELKDAILALNPYDYITVHPEVGEGEDKKKVVLVFDDLERSKLDTKDVLGCINEYCENQHFSTIIVANEEKIKHDADNYRRAISYNEIKEKIVCRTVKYQSGYDEIIRSIIENKKWDSDKYKTFLTEKTDNIISIFGPEEQGSDNKIRKPHNIRSLKCALQDFCRIYKKLDEAGIPEIERYFYSFLSFTLALREGDRCNEGTDEFIFEHSEVEEMYPSFNPLTLLESGRNWVLHGIWDENAMDDEIRSIRQRLEPLKDKDILRMNRFIELEEDVIQRGFSELLDDCYSGELTLNEYVDFIINSYFIRECKIKVNESIDWDKIQAGIRIRFQKTIDSEEGKDRIRTFISDEDYSTLTEDERKTYDLIEGYRKDEPYIFERNKKLYLTTAKKEGAAVFTLCKNRRFRAFDTEMATATRECFEQCDQGEKPYFSQYFRDFGVAFKTSKYPEVEESETKRGYEELIRQLQELKESYVSAGRKVAAYNTGTFIEVVQEMVEQLETMDA